MSGKLHDLQIFIHVKVKHYKKGMYRLFMSATFLN